MVIELGIKMLGGEGEEIPTLPLRVLGVTLGSPVSGGSCLLWGELGVYWGVGRREDPHPPFLRCWYHRDITQGSLAS